MRSGVIGVPSLILIVFFFFYAVLHLKSSSVAVTRRFSVVLFSMACNHSERAERFVATNPDPRALMAPGTFPAAGSVECFCGIRAQSFRSLL